MLDGDGEQQSSDYHVLSGNQRFVFPFVCQVSCFFILFHFVFQAGYELIDFIRAIRELVLVPATLDFHDFHETPPADSIRLETLRCLYLRVP